DMIELAHEALLQRWEPLRKWIDDDRKFLRWRQTLNLFRTEWERSGRATEYLLKGGQLAEAAPFKARTTDLTLVEREYINESPSFRGRSQFFDNAAAAIVLVGAALGGGWWAYTRSDRYQVSQAIVSAPLRDALNFSFSDTDPHLITIQDWICTLIARRGCYP